MSKRSLKLIDQIRGAVAGAGVSRYRICKATGIDEAAMSRFMAGKVGLSMEALDALAACLGLHIEARGPVRVPPKQKAGRKPKPKGR